MNIGIHFFDMLQWIFGAVEKIEVHVREPQTLSGRLVFAQANVRWFLSLDGSLLPQHVKSAGGAAYRSLTIEGQAIDFSEGFTDLHTRVYEDILAGGGFGISDARPSIDMVFDIRHAEISSPGADAHPLLNGAVAPCVPPG